MDNLENVICRRGVNLLRLAVTVLKLSPGKHNDVQAAVIEQFAPRFAPRAIVLYMGDTSRKNLILDKQNLATVTSHGPMTPKRTVELSHMFTKDDVGLIYVSTFLDFSQFNKHVKKIAWDTEVWIVEFPDHMIHYNGDKFLGPRKFPIFIAMASTYPLGFIA